MKELSKISHESRPASLLLLPKVSNRLPVKIKDETSLVTMVHAHRQKIGAIAFYIIFQCIIVFLASASVLRCVWSPDQFASQHIKVIVVMYLYDYEDCGYGLQKAKGIQTIKLNRLVNQTKGLEIKPVLWSALKKSTSTRLTESTVRYIEISIGFHCLWMLLAIVAWISSIIRVLNFKYLKRVITVFLYGSIFMAVFDVSMGIVYLAHIQQSLTTSMVLRYAGWAVELKVNHPEEFAGWIPMLASVCWMRGIVFLVINLLFIKTIWRIRKKIKKKEVIKKHSNRRNRPIPESTFSMHDTRISYNKDALIFHA